jgi:protein TonB
MTNKEILQASLLDILFANRNKEYGAYALRRGYNHRLLTATFGSLAASLLIFFTITFRTKTLAEPQQVSESGGVTIKNIEFSAETRHQQTKVNSKPAPKIASAKLVSNFVIKEDFLVKQTDVPEIKDLVNEEISTNNSSGIPSDGTIRAAEKINTGVENTSAQKQEPFFTADQKEPEFPGGREALTRFLLKNLNTPDELQAGESKTVQIRLLVSADGMVNNLEVLKSGGPAFDREVIRVCKKMPRWKPAVQNGSTVAVSYVLPVTFISVEQ